jgi:putative transposase
MAYHVLNRRAMRLGCPAGAGLVPADEEPRLSECPVALPEDWAAVVSEVQAEPELARVRQNVRRGSPLGAEGWVRAVVEALGLQGTQRPRGRPRKREEAASDAVKAS